MMSSMLCRCFKRLNISVTGIFTKRYSTACDQFKSRDQISHHLMTNLRPQTHSIFEPNLRLAAGNNSIIDLSLPQIRITNEIIESPIINNNAHIIEPTKISHIEDKIPEKSLNLPTIGVNIEKHAARLIVIRRKKMRKHKRRKLRKKMKFVWRKVKQRRETRREKAFHQELLGQIREAEKFDAKSYVASRLQILDDVRLPNKYRGELLPEAMIRQFLKKKMDEKERKRNKPANRLTL